MNFKYNSPLRAEIDLNAFRYNIKSIRNKFPNSKIILPVKANAYGHGDLIISKESEKIGIDYLAVARVIEGIKLRNNNIKLSILNLGIEYKDNLELAINNNIELTIGSIDNLLEIENFAKKKNKEISVHLKIDTGMTRLGCITNECLSIADYINSSKYLIFKSCYSHFARSDDNIKFTQKQTDLFLNFINLLSIKNIHPEFIHLFNSGGIINTPIYKNYNIAIRPGISSYGYSPIINDSTLNLKPVMTLKSKIIHIKKVPKGTGVSYGHTFFTKKPTYLGTIPLGYGDGFHRLLSNNFNVLINNKTFPQRGTISMDLTVIEIDETVKINDDVIIFGNKDNFSNKINDANDLARKINTISYEITTSLTERVKRIPIN